MWWKSWTLTIWWWRRHRENSCFSNLRIRKGILMSRDCYAPLLSRKILSSRVFFIKSKIFRITLMSRRRTKPNLIKSQLILISEEPPIFSIKSSFPKLRWSYDNSKNLTPKVEISLLIMEEVYPNSSFERKYRIFFNLTELILINTTTTVSPPTSNTIIAIRLGERILNVWSTSLHKKRKKDLTEGLGFCIHRDPSLKITIKILL